ncbi:MAG: hypothetical protein Q8S24_08085 [Eubacteriales bacterium]|nr:hypothetical protein [Eubacteriales bacterium]
MKKVLIVLIVLSLLIVSTIPALAHPTVPPQSLGKISINAATGMATAYHGAGDLACKGGIAAHVFEQRFMCVFHPVAE